MKISLEISNGVTKKKITFILFLLTFLTFFFLFKADLNSPTSRIKKVKEIINQETSAFAQIIAPAFFPRYPQRLSYIAEEMVLVSQDLAVLNEELNNLTEGCDCQYAKSKCQRDESTKICNPWIGWGKTSSTGGTGTGGTEIKEVYGDPCRERGGIDAQQRGIRKKLDQLVYLRNLLQVEISGGIEEELKEINTEDAEVIRNNLQTLLEKSSEIMLAANRNYNLPADCIAQNCTASCQTGESFRIEACLETNVGEQQPFKTKFNIGVSLDDIQLTPIKVKNLKMGLPDEIAVPPLPKIPSFTIPLPDLTIAFPEVPVGELDKLSLKPVVFYPPSPPLPEAPLMNIICPQQPAYQEYCSEHRTPSSGQSPLKNTGLSWYFQTLSWLSQQCQELPAMKDKNTQLPTTKASECFEVDDLLGTTTKDGVIEGECDSLWVEYYQQWLKYKQGTRTQPPEPPPRVCVSMGVDYYPYPPGAPSYPSLRPEAIAQQCRNLYVEVGEEVPLECKETQPTALSFLKVKCQQLNKAGEEDAPEPCKVLSLFTKQIESPDKIDETAPEKKCKEQRIIDYAPIPGCPSTFPTIPKIPLSQLDIPQIPNIDLPHYKFLPFFELKLPDIKFEPLRLPDIELCNLDACKDIFPTFRFSLPSLTIPGISIPSITVPTYGGMKVEIEEIKFPSLPFRFEMPPMISLTNPVIEVPEIPLPQPKFSFGFAGFEGLGNAFLNFLLGLVKAIPIPEGCLWAEVKYIPLKIILPDKTFPWPAFPRVPDACGNIREFCKKAKTKLGQVATKVDVVNQEINNILQAEIQQKLNEVAGKVQDEIKKQVSDRLEAEKGKIQAAIDAAIDNRQEIDGMIRISPTSVQLDDIPIPEINLTDYLPPGTTWPEKIDLPWKNDPAMKEITLGDELIYELTDAFGGESNKIPLSRLSYSYQDDIDIPGFQKKTPSIDFRYLENYPSCVAQAPSGGNPCPEGKEENLSEIEGLGAEIEQAAKDLIDVLK